MSLHNRVIARLAKDSAVTSGDLDVAFRALDEAAADNIGAARAGIWLFEDSNTRLVARDHYDLITRSHKRELCFNAREFPFYFQALEEGRPLVAHQAEFDPRTVELLDGYLEPHGISALLAAPITVHEELVGALVVEHVGPPRTWTPEEQSFASSIADIVVLAIVESERTRSELAVAADRARLERIFASTRDTIFTLNADGQFTFVSPAVEHGTGLTPSEVQGRHWHELIAPQDHSRVENALSKLTSRELPSVTVEYRVLHRDGQERWQEATLSPMPDDDGDTTVVGVARDITSRRENTASDVRIEERVRDSQKMEAIGRLAGGIAHDFNNLLTVITSGVELGLASLPSDSPARSNLETVMDASGRAASLTKQLRAFGRGQVLDLETVSLNDIVGSTVELLRRLTRENVQIRASLDQHLWPVRADQTQIEQILVNLTVNASDAMPDGGVLKLQTENVMVGEDEAAGLGELEPGRYIRLTVTDTGSGISDDDLPHIFEPFFTTKPHAGGGLGLAVTFGIVSQHGGHIHA
ncbi:MAG: PAS domain S-box protein, partial [Gammaproteobacteria bacterium]|nr:PAS domain S-box protein [Gammaproteobacteria bacterium]